MKALIPMTALLLAVSAASAKTAYNHVPDPDPNKSREAMAHYNLKSGAEASCIYATGAGRDSNTAKHTKSVSTITTSGKVQ